MDFRDIAHTFVDFSEQIVRTQGRALEIYAFQCSIAALANFRFTIFLQNDLVSNIILMY